MTISCPACRHENTDTAKFCLKCGTPMAPATPAAPIATAAAAVEPPRAPEVVSATVQETPFGSVNVNVTVTPRPPPVPPPPPTFAPKPAAAPAATPAPLAKSGGNTSLVIGVVVVAALAGAAFVFMGKGDAPVPAPVVAPAAAPAPQAASQPLTSKEILNQILGLVRDNRWQDVKPKVNSLKELVQVSKGNRASSEKLTQDGAKMLESNNTAEAITLFEKAIAEDASYYSPRSLLGRTLSRSGKSDAARLVLVDALVMEPDRGGTWFSAAEMFAEMGKPEESASALKLAIHFASNRETAMQFLQDKSKFPSEKFWSVVENNRPALNGVPPYKTN